MTKVAISQESGPEDLRVYVKELLKRTPEKLDEIMDVIESERKRAVRDAIEYLKKHDYVSFDRTLPEERVTGMVAGRLHSVHILEDYFRHNLS